MTNRLNILISTTKQLKAAFVGLLLTILCLPLIAHSQTNNLLATLTSEKQSAIKALDSFNHRIDTLEKTSSLNTSQKTELNHHYQTRDLLQRSLSSIERTQDYYQAYQDIPSQMRRIEQELATALPTEFKVDRKQALSTLEQHLENARTELQTVRKIRNDIESEATQRSERLQKISNESASARKRQEELNQLLASPLPSNEESELTAKQSETEAERDYVKLLLLELEQEQHSYEARRELLRARRQQAERQVLIAEQRFNALEQRVNQLRTSVATQAMQAADSAILAATSAHPLVRAIVDENQKLAAELAQISTQSASISTDKQKLEETLSIIKRQYEGIKEKITQIGLSDAIGLKLRSDLNQLPDSSAYATALKQRRIDVNRVQLRRIEIEDRLLALVDVKREAQHQLSTAGNLSDSESQALQNALQTALTEQRDNYLNELIKAYDIHFEKRLFPIMEGERELLALINEYREFIDSRILWIQSSSPLAFNDITRLSAAIPWLLDPSALLQTGRALGKDLLNNPWSVGTPLLAFALLVGFYGRLKEKLSELGRYVTKLSKAKFTDTLMAAIVTSLMVLPWPMLIYLLAWRTELSSMDNHYAAALASGLYIMAYLLFLGLLLRRICRPNGLGESHFRWKTEHLTLIRRHLAWFLPTALPLAFIVATTMDQPTQAHHDSLGRIAFITLMILTSLFAYALFTPPKGLFKNDIEKNPGSWLDRLSGVWIPLILTTPIALAFAAAWGYFYTAIELYLYAISTIGMIFAIKIIHEFFIRWLNIVHRKLALEQRFKKLESEAADKNEKQTIIEPTPNESPELDVANLSTQTMRLMNSAYWLAIIIGTMLIWSDVLPALKLLNEIVLWSSQTTGSDGVVIAIPTTLANVLLAITIFLMTLFISRNIPGLLEIAILQHLPFTPSGRYAITTITRYVLIIIGLSMTFSALGIGWSKVQWLAAAITVGLGFGLQEIFANFVSGLIILFERQIRVGDAVTVGNISGKVSRIQMRATTITDWDRKELIIPNKEFVTGQVINWSLSDTILRILIPVGIAYGSDTKRAYDELLAAAHAHHNVLADPEPSVRFVSFGESSLDFELRVYIPHPDVFLETKHDLHMDIDQRFRDANIEIAFPQRDIHIRDIPSNFLKPEQGPL